VPTGGNHYNRQILAHGLHTGVQATSIRWPVEAPPKDATAGLDAETPVVIDSLCIRHGDAIRRLRAALPTTRLVLLAHYLHCVDPRSPDAEAAQRERTVLPLVDAVIAPSAYVCVRLQGNGVPFDRTHVVAPGLDDRFRGPVPDRAARDALPVLLTVANVLPGKGLDVMLDALARLEDLDWRWRLVGGDALDTAYAARFRQALRRAPFRECVTWEGTVDGDDMPGVYDAADVFVLPTRFETCSLATREAMARGLPVVASRVGGLPENVGEADAGHLVPPDEASALAAALRDLLERPDARRTMGRAAHRQSQAFPTWTAAASRFARIVSGTNDGVGSGRIP